MSGLIYCPNEGKLNIVNCLVTIEFSQNSSSISLYHSRKWSWSWRVQHKTLTLSSNVSMSRKTLRKQTRTTGMLVYFHLNIACLRLSASMVIMHATCACVWNVKSLGTWSTNVFVVEVFWAGFAIKYHSQLSFIPICINQNWWEFLHLLYDSMK